MTPTEQGIDAVDREQGGRTYIMDREQGTRTGEWEVAASKAIFKCRQKVQK